MSRTWIPSSLLFAALVLCPAFASAQTDEEAAKARQLQQQAKENAEIQKGQAALREFLNAPGTFGRTPTGAEGELRSRLLEFRLAIPKFRTATNDYRWALGIEDSLEKPLKNIESQTDVLLRYFTAAKMKRPRQDPAEFKDYSAAELQWETLNSAERVGTFLDVVVVADRQETVSKITLEFLSTLNGELVRLKWLASHTR